MQVQDEFVWAIFRLRHVIEDRTTGSATKPMQRKPNHLHKDGNST